MVAYCEKTKQNNIRKNYVPGKQLNLAIPIYGLLCVWPQ